MKRNLLFLIAVLAASFASATVTSSNTLCWIKVDNTCTNVVISTALVDVGLPATNSIDVSNFILTNNLNVGDSLVKKVLSGGKWTWEGWAVGAKGWEAVSVTSGDRQFAAASDNGLSLANAFVLHRSDPVRSNPVYLRGQVESSVSRTQTASESVTLMANACLTNVFIETIPWDDGKGPSNGDKIRFLTDNAGTGTIDYTWTTPNGGSTMAWCTNVVTTVNPGKWNEYDEEVPVAIAPGTVNVPVGQGFYFSRSRKSIEEEKPVPSVTWTVND